MILRALSGLWTAKAAPMGDHLWQSTLFLALATIVAVALRKNQARVRYWVWLTLSVKFLIPFSLLIALGSHLARPQVSTPAQIFVYSAVEDFSQPFAEQQKPIVYHSAPASVPVSLIHPLPTMLIAGWLIGIVAVLLRWIVGWVRISLMVRRSVPIKEEPEADALRRVESSLGVRKPIRLVLSPDWMEPGIFGIFRPVLIWPEGISQHLDDRHIEAILTHEVCHARRHDNLTAVLHMVVEGVFWFHPLVWWVGARLEEERERACDEQVSILCNQPHVYAESILRVCKFCSESPLACVSGITGADLKKRLMQIMTERVVRKLDFSRKVLLLVAALTVVAVPVLLGQAKAAQRMMLAGVDKAPMPFRTAAHAMIALDEPSSGKIAELQASSASTALTQGQAEAKPFKSDGVSIRPADAAEKPSMDAAELSPSASLMPVALTQDGPPARVPQFDEVSIKPSRQDDVRVQDMPMDKPDGFDMRSNPLLDLIRAAYGPTKFPVNDRILGAPDWAKQDRFDIQAKVSTADVDAFQRLSFDQRRPMLQALLEDRFRLRVHSETRQIPIYELVVAKSGVKLKETKSDDIRPEGLKDIHGQPINFGLIKLVRPSEALAQATSMTILAMTLSQPSLGLGRPVVDKTGLAGAYDFNLKWTPDQVTGGPATADASEASIFRAIQEQLGLKLEPAKGPVEVLVVDYVERPSAN